MNYNSQREEVLLWFKNLPFEDKLRTFSFYAAENPEAQGPIGVIDNTKDYDILYQTYDVVRNTPEEDAAGVAEAVIRQSLENHLIEAMANLSTETLSKMMKDLQDSGLGVTGQSTSGFIEEYSKELLAAHPQAGDRWANKFKEASESLIANGDSASLLIGHLRWDEYEEDELLTEIAAELNISTAKAQYVYKFLANQEINRLDALKRQQDDITNNKKTHIMEISQPFKNYSAYQLSKLLNEVVFPAAGKDTEFDAALKQINDSMHEGWTENLSEAEIKSYLLDLINSLPAAVQAHLAEAISSGKVSLAKDVFDDKPYDVYTIGFSRKSQEEFLAAIPGRATILIDTRKRPGYNRFYPQFNASSIAGPLKEKGITIINIKESDPDFIEKVRQVILENNGKVIIASMESQPSKCARGQVWGPKLERVGISVGHITQDFNKETKTWSLIPKLRSQEEVTLGLLGNIRIVKGSYKNIIFNEDGSIVESPGVKLEKKEFTGRNRLLPTNWNYGKEVHITETENEGYDAAVRSVTSRSNVTLVFATGRDPKHLSMAKIDKDAIRVTIPDDKDLLHNPDYAKRLVNGSGRSGIKDRIDWALLRQKAVDPDNFNPQELVLGVVGSNISRICTKKVLAKVTDEELSQGDKALFYEEMGGFEAGNYIMTESTDITQDDINIFVRNVLAALMEPEEKTELRDLDTDPHFHISELVAIGETGAGIAAAIAGQQLQLDKVSMQALKDYEHTIDDESLSGKKVKDAPSIINYLNLGFKNPISQDERLMQIDYARSLCEKDEHVGLTDKQVLVLSELGFSNSDILTMVTQASVNGIKIKESPVETVPGQVTMSGRAELLEFIQMCREGYGVDVDVDINEEHILIAETNVTKMLNNERRNGIGVITVANPLYPTQLRNFQGFSSFTEEEGLVVSDGAASFGIVRHESKEERPAVLRFKGNIEALGQPVISIVGNESSSEESRRIAGNLGREIAESGISVVTSIRRAKLISHSTIITAKDLLGMDTHYDRELDNKGIVKVAAHDDSETAARSAAIAAGASTIVITPNGLNFKEDADQINAVVSSGGIVLSEAGFDADESPERLHVRAGYLACAIGSSAILVDGKDPDFGGVNPSNELEAANGNVFVVRYPGAEGAHPGIKGNEVLISNGASTIDAAGRGLELPVSLARTASQDNILDEVLEKESIKESQQEAQKQGPKYIGRLKVSVVRKGTSQVFVVPEEYTAVRDALKLKYGEDIVFSNNLGLTKRNMTGKSVNIQGEDVITFSGYKGTEILNEPTYTVPLFYIEGEIYSLFNAPADTPHLENIKKRIENRDLIEQLKTSVDAIHGDYMKLLDFPEDTNIRFNNAYYFVKTQNGVEIFEGPEMRASIQIDTTGKLRVKNYEPLSLSLRESNPEAYLFDDADADLLKEKERIEREPFFNDFSVIKNLQSTDMNIRKAAMTTLSERIREKVIGLGNDAKNLDVAASDISAAIAAGTLVEPGQSEYQREMAIACLTSDATLVQKDIRKLISEEKKAEKELQDLTNQREAAYTEAASPSELGDAEAQVQVTSAKLNRIRKDITKLRTRYAILEEHKVKVVMAEKVLMSKSESSGKNEKVTLFVDGLPIEIMPGRVLKNTPWESITQFISDTKNSEEEKRVAFEESIERIENRSVTLKNIGELYDKAHQNDSGLKKADRKEILQDSLLNGRYIVVRNGKMAYADEQLNIRSDFYDHLAPWNGRFGLATNGDKHNFIGPDGKQKVEVWFDTRRKTVDDVFVITSDGEYGLIGDKGLLIGGRMFNNARDIQEGWSVVQGGLEDGENAGKFNYINKEGKFITRGTWFDQAGDFSNGEARAIKDGKEYKLTTDGKVEKISKSKSKGV